MFNRHGKRLSIGREFWSATAQLSGTPFEWLDCEALERRHNIGQGSLIVLDWIPEELRGQADPTPEGYNFYGPSYQERRARLEERFVVMPVMSRLADNSVVIPFETPDSFTLWQACKTQNESLGCPFYEGVVGRESAAPYPFQLRSDSEEFAGMVKHRWKF